MNINRIFSYLQHNLYHAMKSNSSKKHHLLVTFSNEFASGKEAV